MKYAYIFDLDGTLCDNQPRVQKYLLDKDEADWNAFYDHCGEDGFIAPTCSIAVALFNRGFDILFVTGRRESCRKDTLKWISDNLGPEMAISEHLFMRTAEDGHREDYVCKMRNYHQHIEHKWGVWGVFEDRNQCVRAWRDLGLQCYQVDDGGY